MVDAVHAATEDTHEVVLERDIEAGEAGVALASGTAAQLVVDSAGLMALGADDIQAAGSPGGVVELDIGTTACHVGGDGHTPVLTGMGDDLCLDLMVLRIQHVVGNADLLEHSGELLRGLDRDRADKDRLALLVALLDRRDDRVELFFSRLVDRILMVHTDDRLVGRDLDDVHAVDLAELMLLGQGGTGHTALLVKLVEEVLEGDGRKGLGLLLDLHVLLCLDSLVQAVAVAAPGHHSTRELIDDQNLIVLDDVVVVLLHQVVGAQGQDDAVLDLQVLGIGEVFDVEELLGLCHALLGQVDDLVLLVDDEVAVLLLLDTHDGVDLGDIVLILAPCHLLCQDVAGLIDPGGLIALSGDDERGSCLIDQDGVDLIDDAVVQAAQNQLVLVDGHVVTQVVKAELVVGDIGHIAPVGLLALLGVHGV